MASYWVVANVFCRFLIMLGARYARFRKSRLPDGSAESEFTTRTRCESAFYELHSPFNADVGIDRQQHMEMIGHHDEFVQPEFLLGAVVVKNLNEQLC